MTTTDALFRIACEERYRMLRRALQLATTRPDWNLRLEQAQAIRVEIRALVRIKWFVRRQVRRDRARREAVMTLPEQGDPITAAQAVSDRDYHPWQAVGPR